MSTNLPPGWRSGTYTAEELLALGVGSEIVVAEEERCRERVRLWGGGVFPESVSAAEREEHRREWSKVLQAEHPGLGVHSAIDGGITLLLVYGQPVGDVEEGESGGTRINPPPGPRRVLPGVTAPTRRRVLFSRLWKGEALLPCLTYRLRDSGRLGVALEGLEAVVTRGSLEPLLGRLRLFRRISAAGRPPLSAGERAGWREKVVEGETIKRRSPATTWPQIAARIGTSPATLHRWRAKAKADGITENS